MLFFKNYMMLQIFLQLISGFILNSLLTLWLQLLTQAINCFPPIYHMILPILIKLPRKQNSFSMAVWRIVKHAVESIGSAYMYLMVQSIIHMRH